MKLCHENNGAAVYVGRAATVHNRLFQMFTTQLNILARTFLLVGCFNRVRNLL